MVSLLSHISVGPEPGKPSQVFVSLPVRPLQSKIVSSAEMVAESAEHIFRSPLPNVSISHTLPLESYVFEHSAEFLDKPAIIEGKTGRIYTYEELITSVRRFACNLKTKLGIRKGDVVMVLLPNCPEFIVAFLGVARAGAVVTPVNPFFTLYEVSKQVETSRSRVVITEKAYYDKVAHLQEQGKLEVVLTDVNDDYDVLGCISMASLLTDVNGFGDQTTPIEQGTDVVALPFSSGTTSLPKGVELTHRNVITCIALLVDGENPNFYLDSNDRMLCVIPMFHIYCMNCVLLSSLRVGGAIVVMQKYDLGEMLGLIEKHKVTAACFVPPILLAIAKSPLVNQFDLSSVRFVMSGAAPLGKELEEQFKMKMPNTVLAQGYGMTEAGPLISMSLAFAKHPSSSKPGSCGVVVRNTEAKVVDTQTGKPLKINLPGEICIRGPQVMKGYLDNPQATALTVDKDGWLHTGDIGYIDEDGEMFIVDRVKELIKFKGFQVAPAELEALLVSHSQIADAAVVGKIDEVAGEVPVAFVVLKSAKGNEMTVNEEDIKKFVSSQVVFYKRLSAVVFVDSIPKSAAGKILRKSLKGQLNSIVL